MAIVRGLQSHDSQSTSVSSSYSSLTMSTSAWSSSSVLLKNCDWSTSETTETIKVVVVKYITQYR